MRILPDIKDFHGWRRHMKTKLQVRFYECTLATDPDVLADNYCRWGDGAPIISTKGTVIPS
jgi:hypothetical protein